MKTQSIVLEQVTYGEFQRLKGLNYPYPPKDTFRFAPAEIKERPRYSDYESLLEEFLQQPHAGHIAFYNPTKEGTGGFEKIYLADHTPQALAEALHAMLSLIPQVRDKKGHFELAYVMSLPYSRQHCATVAFEERDRLIVPFKVFIPHWMYSHFSWRGVHPDTPVPVFALSDPLKRL